MHAKFPRVLSRTALLNLDASNFRSGFSTFSTDRTHYLCTLCPRFLNKNKVLAESICNYYVPKANNSNIFHPCTPPPAGNDSAQRSNLAAVGGSGPASGQSHLQICCPIQRQIHSAASRAAMSRARTEPARAGAHQYWGRRPLRGRRRRGEVCRAGGGGGGGRCAGPGAGVGGEEATGGGLCAMECGARVVGD